MPRITNLRANNAHEDEHVIALSHSTRVERHPQLLPYDTLTGNGTNIGKDSHLISGMPGHEGSGRS